MNFQHAKILLFLVLSAGIALLPFLSALSAAPPSQPVEIGDVSWGRDLSEAFARSKQSKKPVFLLFQEVPGCSGCKDFGATVLKHPLMVEAIESLFVPVVIYNNHSGKDAEVLKRYDEPAWNFQVIRFLDENGQDILPRQDRIWTLDLVAKRMALALEAAGQSVPEYLHGLSYEYSGRDFASNPAAEAAFAMFCFWTGEKELGAIPGVIKTEAGFYDGREVTRVWYDPEQLSLAELVKDAEEVKCAQRLYLRDPAEFSHTRLQVKAFQEKNYRSAPADDQKKQIQHTTLSELKLTDYQKTKLNAFFRQDRARALQFLSPKQRKHF